jgi:hypothetical protein
MIMRARRENLRPSFHRAGGMTRKEAFACDTLWEPFWGRKSFPLMGEQLMDGNSGLPYFSTIRVPRCAGYHSGQYFG